MAQYEAQSNDRYDFRNPESIAQYMLRSGDDKGEILLRGYALILQYDIATGEVNLRSNSNNDSGLTNIYSPQLIKHFLDPLSSGICIVSRWHLLKCIGQVNEPEISNLIQKHHINSQNEPYNLNHQMLSKTYNGILHICKPTLMFDTRKPSPTKLALYTMLRQTKFEEINCKDQIQPLIANIEQVPAKKVFP